jgi:hypothetical protein
MRVLLLLGLPLLGWPLTAQQVPDTTFVATIASPAFEPGTGPTVCIDEGHNNSHTLNGSYRAFGGLLEADGFLAEAYSDAFTPAALSACGVLAIANALAPENALRRDSAGIVDREWLLEAWRVPHRPAFGADELEGLLEWVRDGGRLLLVMDHAPFAGAAASLATLIGAMPLNGPATYRLFVGSRGDQEGDDLVGTLGNHPILRGRPSLDHPVDSILTFGGAAFLPADGIAGLLHLPPGAYGVVSPYSAISMEGWPRFPLDGWVAAVAGTFGSGKVVVLGEAAMCTAQVRGASRSPMGMNHPQAGDNSQFCLNVVRWLTDVL